MKKNRLLLSNVIDEFNFIEFLRYFSVCFFALIIDVIFYLFFLSFNVFDIPTSASVSYSVGVLYSYFIIRKSVFTNGWLRNKKSFEILLFIISALLGVFVTYVTSGLSVEYLGFYKEEAKMAAIFFSFLVTYLFRKFIVFRI